MKAGIIIFFLFIAFAKCFSQEYNYYHYDVRDGLSGINVYSIAQDKDGFLWFGTETGLSRFDGSNFKNYSSNEGLNDNDIISLFVDSKNRIWIFPFKNALYYYYNGKIYNYTNDSLLKKFHLRNEIFKACEDKDGNIFFLEQKKIHILTSSNEVIDIDKINDKYFDNNSCGISTNGYCNMYVSLTSGLPNDHRVNIFEYKNAQWVFKEVFRDSSTSRNGFIITPAYNIIKNDLVFQIFHTKSNEYFTAKAPKRFHTLSYLNDSSFIISTFDKTYLYSVNQRKIIDSFLLNKIVNRCFSDKEGNIWFATATQGSYRLSSTKFKTYKVSGSLNYKPTYAINLSGKKLYIGSDENIFLELDLRSNGYKKINLEGNYIPNKLSNIQVLNNGDVFLGSNVGLYKIHNKKATIFFPDLAIKSFYILNDSIVIATDRGVFESSIFSTNHIDTIWNNRATCTHKTNSQYYIGTLNGLYTLKNNFDSSAIDLGAIYRPLKNKITGIESDKNGNLWVATESNGLVCLKNDKPIYNLTTKNGLVSNLCRCIYISGNNIWLGTNSGISKIDISNHSVTNFTAAEGLDCEIINCIYATGDSVFAGTPFGITFFDASTTKSTSLCSLKLLDIQSEARNWYFNQDSIQLGSHDNLLHFEYAGISFKSAGDITYYYQLQGLNNAWRSTKQTVIEFPSLHAGDYRLNIYARNKYGTKSNIISIPFSKAKTFWQLPWIWLLMLVCLAFISFLIIKTRIRIIKRNADEKILRERQLNELEQMALRSQMNPHFIFNSLNSIQQFVFAGNVLEANQFITEFSSLVRQTLYISAKKFISLEEEIKYLQTYLALEQVKYENIFTFKITASEDVPEDVPIPPLLVQPFIENSIRHGVLNLKDECGEILVDFSTEDDYLLCVVKDNGIGRESAMKLKAKTEQNHQSKGMELIQKRIESLNSIYKISILVIVEDIVDTDKTGTQVKIKFPLSYDNE